MKLSREFIKVLAGNCAACSIFLSHSLVLNVDFFGGGSYLYFPGTYHKSYFAEFTKRRNGKWQNLWYVLWCTGLCGNENIHLYPRLEAKNMRSPVNKGKN